MNRVKWIDNAKGIGILLIILGHVSSGLTGSIQFQFVYGVHLVIFFVLSGYTLKKAHLNKEYVNAKFNRLMTQYFYTCAAVLFMDVINSRIIEHDISIQTITRIIGNDLMRSFFASGSIKTFGNMDLGTRIGAIWLVVSKILCKVQTVM